MLQYDAVIFDLDGTLTNSERGIVACVRYALEKMNRPVPDADTLRKFIGPPLSESFRIYCGMDEAETEEAVRVYRERYLPIGWAENEVYPGIRALLKALKAQGADIYVATGKPQTPSERILRHFELMQYIQGVAGPTDEDPTADKAVLIRRALNGKSYRHPVMVGDRLSDVMGAKAAGIEGIGVMYGFGEPDEFKGADCKIAQDIGQLSMLLLDEIPRQKGYFISMEGLDGCGKTTQANAVEKALREYGFTVRRTREPGGCPISEKIRDLLLDVNNKGMSDIAEALLYAASRAQHVQEVILPAMERGEIVLCDRFVDSSVAFQGGGRQLGVPLIQQINAPAIEGCKPDTTVFLQLDHETSLRRRENASALDRMESEKAAFHARVEEAYALLVSQEPERFITVDARQTPEQITREILPTLLERMKKAGVL